MTTIIFFASFFVLLALIGSKMLEERAVRAHPFSHFFSVGDEKIHKIIDLVVFKYNRYKKIAHIFMFEFIPCYTYELLVRMKDYVSKKYYSSADGFRGRRVLRSNGSVSFFLESLSDDKTRPEARKV